MKYIFSIILITYLLFISCSEQITEPTDQAIELLPLKLGNYWIYNVGVKDSYNDTILTFRDTLRIIEQTDQGFLLRSRLQIILLNGYYKNGADGLYMNDTLQFKYPGIAGENCGQIGLGNIFDVNGFSPVGIISRTDFKYSYISSGDTINLPDCYYYFLSSFYSNHDIKTTGYTVFKPGVGMVLRDWVDINEIVNEFYNSFASLIEYHIE